MASIGVLFKKIRPSNLFGVFRGSLKVWKNAGIQKLLEHSGVSPFWAVMAIAFREKGYIKEFQRIQNGVGWHRALSSSKQGNRFRLRRGLHRLEKGILLADGSRTFAGEYIGEVVDDYLAGDFSGSLPEQEWAIRTLDRYFSVVLESPAVEQARQRYQKTRKRTLSQSLKPMRKYEQLEKIPEGSFASFKRLVEHRKSIRKFLDVPVDRSLLDRAIDTARHAPSGCNRQPYQFLVIHDAELRESLLGLTLGAKTFARFVPVVVAVVAKARSLEFHRDRQILQIDASLSSMIFALALESIGLGSCFINWPDLPDKDLTAAQILGLDSDERVVLLMAVGYPDPEAVILDSDRKSLEEIRRHV